MRKVREVLRLKYESERSHAEIAASLGIGESTVGDYVSRARAVGIEWPAARELTETELEAKLFRSVGRNEPPARVAIDFAWVHRELARAGVTLQTIWVEYRDAATGKAPLKPYEYSRFCDLYARWKKTVGLVMRQVHRAGEKVFIDYSGKKPRIVDPTTGEITEVELFVAVLGASNYTFAEATRSQKLADFVGSTIRAFEYFGAVPEIVVPDQLRSAVSGPDRYEPDINPTYLEMAQHYGVTVIPARPRKPKDNLTPNDSFARSSTSACGTLFPSANAIRAQWSANSSSTITANAITKASATSSPSPRSALPPTPLPQSIAARGSEDSSTFTSESRHESLGRVLEPYARRHNRRETNASGDSPAPSDPAENGLRFSRPLPPRRRRFRTSGAQRDRLLHRRHRRHRAAGSAPVGPRFARPAQRRERCRHGCDPRISETTRRPRARRRDDAADEEVDRAESCFRSASRRFLWLTPKSWRGAVSLTLKRSASRLDMPSLLCASRSTRSKRAEAGDVPGTSASRSPSKSARRANRGSTGYRR